ncbi:hypothetical protein [Methanimicrococcus hacksteinii]|nr:hypothetical protein [Methanimicrococcus sp. At1]
METHLSVQTAAAVHIDKAAAHTNKTAAAYTDEAVRCKKDGFLF